MSWVSEDGWMGEIAKMGGSRVSLTYADLLNLHTKYVL